MKVLRHAEPARPPDPLPVEIINQIVLYAATEGKHSVSQQHILWKCCLISKQWYYATISRLYEQPLLTNKNFDRFARTMCPPVNAHVSRIGLEDLVRSLDMGDLAYESSKSQTARLLRRIGRYLELFVAPAVSLGVTSHTPLAKCFNLRSLDLSLVFNDIDVPQLFRITGQLPKLSRLNTPPYIFDRSTRFPSAIWPPKLEVVQFNGGLPVGMKYWADMVKRWSLSLSTLIAEDCRLAKPTPDFPHFAGHRDAGAGIVDVMRTLKFTQIKSLRITFSRERSSIDTLVPANVLEDLMTCFAYIENLSIQVAWIAEYFDLLVYLRRGEYLRRLEVTSNSYHLPKTTLTPGDLQTVSLGMWDRLWQLRVDPAILKDGLHGFEGVIASLKRTATKLGQDASLSFICDQDSRMIAFRP